MASDWRLQSIQFLAENLKDAKDPLIEPLLYCGPSTYDKLTTIARQLLVDENIEQACPHLDSLISQSKTNIAPQTTGKSLAGWIRLYTDACLLRSLADLGPNTAHESIARLDTILITCGLASCRVDFIVSIIKRIQHTHLPINPSWTLDPACFMPITCHEPCRHLDSSQSNILILKDPPSLLKYQTTLSNNPFVVRRYARDWPALVEHPWHSAAYLKFVSGPGRVVPIEVGVDYTSQGWTQKLMKWDEFLACLNLDNHSSPPATKETSMMYLAQHNLSLQFPELLADIVIPDYVYASMNPPSPCDYQPPGNDEQLVISMWLGPKGTISPAHTDPYYNLFVQVVGQKMVWLAPPKLSASMYPCSSSEEVHNPAANSSGPGMSNTSRVNVFTSAKEEFPEFWEHVVPEAKSILLEPGDLLYIPPGWWHAMRSEETSFSVSMWF